MKKKIITHKKDKTERDPEPMAPSLTFFREEKITPTPNMSIQSAMEILGIEKVEE